MLEDLRKDISRLIAAYEKEKSMREQFEVEVQKYKAEVESCRKQIAELERQTDNLKLKNAFLSASEDGIAAKEKIGKMIREIDRCISLMEK